MRRGCPIGLAVVALMLTLGIPFFDVKWGFPDDRVLPTSASARQVGDQLRTDFNDDPARNVTVVMPDTTGVHTGGIEWPRLQRSRVPDVSSVSAQGGTFVAGAARRTTPRLRPGTNGSTAFLTVASRRAALLGGLSIHSSTGCTPFPVPRPARRHYRDRTNKP